jgi:hypothetical protein
MTFEQLELFEEWRQVVGYEGYYEVSDWGRVRSVAHGQGRRTGRLLNLKKTDEGYLLAALSKGKSTVRRVVHGLVMAAFVGPCPLGQQIDHIDGDPSHNSILNLRYVTPRQNVQSAIARRGNWHRDRGGPDYWGSKLSVAQVIDIRRLHLEGMTQTAIAKEFGISQGHVWNLVHNKIRKRG